MKSTRLAWYFGLLFAASTCCAQMYRVTDLGTLGGWGIEAAGVNASGQVVGASLTSGHWHAFRTAANRPINAATDDLGTLGGIYSKAYSINASGQVVGESFTSDPITFTVHAFRTAANSPMNAATDDLGTLGGTYSLAQDINASGQVVGGSTTVANAAQHAFRTAANSPINATTDDLGTLGGTWSKAAGINASGQVVGSSVTVGDVNVHAFRTAANSPINPATDDLGTLGGSDSSAQDINASGQVVGYSTIDATGHAFRTAANSPINAATDDLGTLGGTFSFARGINAFGQVVGVSTTVDVAAHAFLYSGGVIYDLNNLIPAGSGLTLGDAFSINDAGQIAGVGFMSSGSRAFLLTPIYKAFVRPPIKADGSSVFKAQRGVLPVKFTLTKNDAHTCTLLPATISITRTTGETPGLIDLISYTASAYSGSIKLRPLPYFRTTGCQYVYNLPTSQLEVGSYRVDISIKGIYVGHAVFATK